MQITLDLINGNWMISHGTTAWHVDLRFAKCYTRTHLKRARSWTRRYSIRAARRSLKHLWDTGVATPRVTAVLLCRPLKLTDLSRIGSPGGLFNICCSRCQRARILSRSSRHRSACWGYSRELAVEQASQPAEHTSQRADPYRLPTCTNSTTCSYVTTMYYTVRLALVSNTTK